MFHRFLLFFTCSTLLFGMTTLSVTAQPCADTQPTIAGAQIVSNNQSGVIYSTPNIPGHTYSWTITGGTIISGGSLSTVIVTWGVVGSGLISVTEINPSIPCNTTVSKTVKIQPLLVSYFYYRDTSNCYGARIAFYDTSVYDVAKPIVHYYLDFGDGTAPYSSAVRPSPVIHFYAMPYNVTHSLTYIVTNNEGTNDTIYDAVYVNPAVFTPVAAFNFTVPNCSYQPVSFDGTISTTPVNTTPMERYAWDFGDPASGAANYDSCLTCGLTTHLFTGPGTYNVTLKVLNHRSCRAEITQVVIIQQSVPTSRFSFSSPTCENNPVAFTDNSTFPAGKNITQWEWNFGDGTSPVTIAAPSNPNVNHVFPGLGPYSVQLVVTNTLGCNDTSTHSVTLTPSPLADFTYGIPCAGDTMKFTNISKQNNGPVIIADHWDFGDPISGNNTSNAVNGAHVYANAGNYTVTLAVTNTTGCPDTIRKSFTVNARPPVDFTDVVGPLNNQYTFHIDSTPGGITNLGSIGHMVSWNFGDGTYNFGDHNPTHTYMGSNNWTVTLTVTDTMGCSNSIAHVIYVPEIPMAFYTSNSPVCANTAMQFTDFSSVPSPPFGYINRWIWNFGDGTPPDTIYFPNPPNVNHMFPGPGSYNVTETVTDNSGFTDSYSHVQVVLALPIANFYFTTGCAGKVVQFTDASFPNGGGNIWKTAWDFGDPLSGINDTSLLANPGHTYATGGVFYTVRLIVTNDNNCVDTVTKQVYVYPAPPVDFTRDTACLGDLVHFYANTTVMTVDSIVTWAWDFGDGTTPRTDPINTSHLYTAAGTYIATLTVSDIHGCANSVSHIVRVNPKPIPEFSWSSPACNGTPILFTDQSTVPAGYTGYIARWLWDFGDGTPPQNIVIPAIPNVTHLFPSGSNTYTVTLTVWTSDSCTLSKVHTITTIPSPIANFSFSTVTCMGQAVQFTDLSQTNGGGSITQWHWNFGDILSGMNNTSTIKNPPHTFAAAGTYTITLIIQNSTGCMDTLIRTITINQLPLANFTADTVCFNTPTVFTDASVPNSTPSTILSWTWDFGDGIQISMQNPSHTYLTYGTFNVKLTVVNANGCTKDTTKQVLVHPLPVPEFSFSSPNCVGAVVSFTDLSTTVPGYLGSIKTWVWNFGDGTTPVTVNAPGSPNVTHTFATTGLSFPVTLTITTSDGCFASIVHTVNLIPAPLANFSFSSTTCASQTVQFTDLTQLNGGGSIVAWHWNFGDPLSGTDNTNTAQNPSHSFTGFLTYNVTLIVTNTSGCHDTIVKTVTVNQLPLAKFTATTACMGTLTTFTDQSVPHAGSIIAWAWNFGDGTTSILQNPTKIFNTYGLQNVTLTITNSNGCIKDTTEQVMVNPLPNAAFTFSSPNCLGAQVQFTNQSTTVSGYLGSIVRWVWDFGDGSGATITGAGNPNISHAFLGPPTSYSVTLTVKTSDSCSASISHIVNLMPSPIASFTFPTSDCANQNVQFTDLSQANGGGNITTWQWNFGDPLSGTSNNSTSQSPGHTFIGPPGVFTVTEIVSNASGCTDTTTHQVTIIGPPTMAFTADTVCLGTLTTFSGSSSGTGTVIHWAWDFGDGQTSTLQSPTHLYLASGVFVVTLTGTTAEGCINHITKSVLVRPKPVAFFVATGPTCAGDTVYFTDQSYTPTGHIQSWHWDFGDGTTHDYVFPNNPLQVGHYYSTGGTFTVSLTITTTDQCTDIKTLQVVIQPAPVANFNYGTTKCANMPLQFTDQSQAGGGSAIDQWLWNFGDPTSGQNTSTDKNPTHSFTHAATFNVVLTVTSATGCHDSISKSVVINATPVAKFTADTACVGGPTLFTDQSTAGSGTIASWLWNFGEPSSITNTSTLQNPTHIYSTPGLYTVTLTVTNSNSCAHDTTKQISVNPKPVAMFQASVACVGDSTAFTDLSIAPGSGIASWHWNFGDGGSSTIQNPKHKYTSASTFNVVLRVTNLAGCVDSISIPVTTHPKPVAAFTYTNFFCPAGQVSFTDQSHGTGSAIIGREWIFQPGSTSSLSDPIFIFSKTDTTYLVSLIVTDSYGCSDTISDSVYVKPAFAFTFHNDTVCFKNATHFTPVDLARGDSLYSISWNFGDPNSGQNNTSYSYHAQHTFLLPGTYVVKLKATDSDNCTDSVFKEVTVHALPAPSFTVISNPCDSVIHFHDSSTVSGSTVKYWIWNFGDGTIDTIPGSVGSGDTSHIYLVQDIYHVTLTVINQFGCSDTLTKSAQLYPCILALFNHADTLMCARYNIAFSDSSLPINIINQWHWVFGDGLDTTYTTHAAVIHHTFANPGTYNVRLIIHAIVAGSGRTFIDTTTQPLVIHATPMPYFSNLSVCKLQTTTFLDTSKTFGTNINYYKWIFGESYSGSRDTSYLKNPTHKYDSAGVYDVKMIAMNRFGCKDSITKPTRVFEIPTAIFDHSLACSGNPTYFTDKTTLGDTSSIVNWVWNFGEVNAKKDTSLIENPTHQYKSSGDFQVRLIVKDQHGCYDTVDSTVTVHITPTSSFTFTENVNNMTGKLMFNNKSIGADTYLWDFGNGQTSTDDNPVVTYANDGSYLIELISSNSFNCTDTTYYTYEFIFKGLYIPNAFAPTSMTSGANVFAPVGVNLKQFKIEVFDSWGNMVWSSIALDATGRPTESWDGKDTNGNIYPSGTFMWKAQGVFIDNSEWAGSDIGKGTYKTSGTVTLIR